MIRRLFIFVLSFVIMISLVSVFHITKSCEVYAAETLNINTIEVGDHIYMGNKNAVGYNGLPYWRVLGVDKINNRALLLSEYVWKDVLFDKDGSPNDGQTKPNEWSGSDAQKWCSEFYKNVLQSSSMVEGVEVLENEVTLFHPHYGTIEITLGPSSITTSDKVFFLSGAELKMYFNDTDGNSDYNLKGYTHYGAGVFWYLRSPVVSCSNLNVSDGINAGCIVNDGDVNTITVNDSKFGGARPAFYLDLSFDISASKDGNGDWVVDGYNEDELTEIDRLLESNSKHYNKELALLAADTCLKTYTNKATIEQYMEDEFGCTSVYSDNYDSGVYAYTIGVKPYSSDTDMIIIAAQGSTNPHELCKDVTAGTKGKCDGYDVYDVVEDFCKEIVDALKFKVDPDKKYKILLTGHSLGGATVNLLSARMINGEIKELCPVLNNPEVFCYTFGSVCCVKSDEMISEIGYESIHNVYNLLDTFSPIQYGHYLLTGMGNGKGKFGKVEPFQHEYRPWIALINRNPIIQIAEHINHDMDKYYHAVQNDYVCGSLTDLGETDLKYGIAACPVDIEIYSNNTLIGQVVNNEVTYKTSDICLWVQGDEKYFLIPRQYDYKIVITATDNGEMNYYIKTLSDTDDTEGKVFSSVHLTNNKKMVSEIKNDSKDQSIQLFAVNNNDEFVTEIKEDGTETEIDYSVKVGDKYSISCGTVQVTSIKSKIVSLVKSKNKKAVTVPATVKIKGESYRVTQINAKAFSGKKIRSVTVGKNVKKIQKNAMSGSKVTTMTLQTKLLKKSTVNGSLNKSKVKTIIIKAGNKAQNKKYVNAYKKIFTKKNAGRKVTVK